MPGTDGVTATSQITSQQPTGQQPARVLVLTTFDLDEYVYAALRAGASGFLLKDTPPAELLAAIRIIAVGDALLAPSVTRKLIREFARRPSASPRPPLGTVTDRERDVLALVARGLSNAEIAAELFITLATVKTHVSRLLTKLAARDRAQLIVIAYESGFVTPANLGRHIGRHAEPGNLWHGRGTGERQPGRLSFPIARWRTSPDARGVELRPGPAEGDQVAQVHVAVAAFSRPRSSSSGPNVTCGGWPGRLPVSGHSAAEAVSCSPAGPGVHAGWPQVGTRCSGNSRWSTGRGRADPVHHVLAARRGLRQRCGNFISARSRVARRFRGGFLACRSSFRLAWHAGDRVGGCSGRGCRAVSCPCHGAGRVRRHAGRDHRCEDLHAKI